jgi:hypothetical protein
MRISNVCEKKEKIQLYFKMITHKKKRYLNLLLKNLIIKKYRYNKYTIKRSGSFLQ